MKNILLVHSSSDLYGSDRALLNIVKNINKKKFKIYVMLPDKGLLVKELEKISGITIIIYPIAVLRRKNLSIKGMFTYFKTFISSYFFLKKYMKKHKIDVVYSNTSVVLTGAFVAKILKIRHVWHVREIIKSDFENKVISFLVRNFSDVVVVNSNETGRALKISPDKIKVVYDAVEEKDFKVNIAKKHNPFTVGMAGRINRWKGQKLFVDMACIVHKKYPKVVFKIAGSTFKGEEHLSQDLQQYINEKNMTDCISMLGHVSDMDQFYNSLDLFVLPSIQPEPFGLVVIEAMEMGIPVIATNQGGPTEIIENQKDGFLVNYTDCKEMSETVMKMIENDTLRKKIGRAGKEKKRKLFSVSKMTKELEMIFLDVLKKNK